MSDGPHPPHLHQRVLHHQHGFPHDFPYSFTATAMATPPPPPPPPPLDFEFAHSLVSPLPHTVADNRRSSPGTSDDSTSPVVQSFEDDFGLTHAKLRDDKPAPAWSELKTKAGKDRKRLPLACIACRRKKIRCSGEKPACKHCLRSRIPCVYKVTARKAAPRTDYMAMLDKRLKRMEERIIKIIPKAEHTPHVIRAVVKPAVPPLSAITTTVTATKLSRKRPGLFDHHYHHHLSSSSSSSSSDAWAKPPSKANLTLAQHEQENKLFLEGIDALPAKHVQEHLAEVFFDNVYGQAYHLLHKPSYMRKLSLDALPPVLVLSVCAVAARFTTNPNISPNPRPFLRGEEWASHARDICTRRYEWPNITILTCLLLLGLHEFGTCHGGRSWALGGQAIRMAFALQLHKDLEYDPLDADNKPLTFIDREIRRRIMWACFLMDRFNSSGSDRPMFIKQESINKIPLPVGEMYFELDMPAQAETLDGSLPPSAAADDQMVSTPESMGVAAFAIRAVALWGRIVAYLNQGGKDLDPHPVWSPDSHYAELDDDVDVFARALPDRFRYSLENLELHKTERTASQFLLLHLSMQQNVLFLGQAAAAAAAAPEAFLADASARTSDAADGISDILRDADKTQCCCLAPFAGYCAFSSTSIHIMRIFSGDPAAKATAEANSGVNIRFLRRMMRYWGMFHWMVDNIRTQYRNALNNAPPRPDASPSMIQYGDWFSRYPHGLSEADFMDPIMGRKREKGDDAVLEQKPQLQSVEDFFTNLSSSPPPPQTVDLPRPAPARRKLTACGSSIKQLADAPASAEEAQAQVPLPGSSPHACLSAGLVQQPHLPTSLGPTPSFSTASSMTSGRSDMSQSQSCSSFGPSPIDEFTQQQQQQQPQQQQTQQQQQQRQQQQRQQQQQQQQHRQQQQQQQQQRQQPPTSSHDPYFSAEMLPVDLPQPQPAQTAGAAQPLDRPISYDDFSMNNGHHHQNHQHEHHQHHHNQNHHHQQGQSCSLTSGEAICTFDAQGASTWFLPFGLDTSNQQSMGSSGVDAFAGMFAGSGNQLDGLRHAL
ncbi:hypothetical protein CP533_3054 [Ophiocordyceps camponoti-saundersi (nom. inval.)]|nr:hypothetical protein CP533_3054 [Ophiocordyceps camponoti-saundersi (nom. inval.)]